MPGGNPSAAYEAFHHPLQQDVSCVTPDVLMTSTGGRSTIDRIHSLSLADGRALITGDGLQLEVGLQYSIIKTGDTGKMAYRCTTKSYAYSILDGDDKRLYDWHWHPFGKSNFYEPHAHTYSTDPLLPPRAHIPTGRVSLEQVIRFVIDQLGVEPLRNDWDSVLSLNEGLFELHRSWRDATEAPRPAPRG